MSSSSRQPSRIVIVSSGPDSWRSAAMMKDGAMVGDRSYTPACRFPSRLASYTACWKASWVVIRPFPTSSSPMNVSVAPGGISTLMRWYVSLAGVSAMALGSYQVTNFTTKSFWMRVGRSSTQAMIAGDRASAAEVQDDDREGDGATDPGQEGQRLQSSEGSPSARRQAVGPQATDPRIAELLLLGRRQRRVVHHGSSGCRRRSAKYCSRMRAAAAESIESAAIWR